MSRRSPVAHPVAARAAIASIVFGIVTGCTGVAVSIPPVSVEPSEIGVASASPPLPTPVARPALVELARWGATRARLSASEAATPA